MDEIQHSYWEFIDYTTFIDYHYEAWGALGSFIILISLRNFLLIITVKIDTLKAYYIYINTWIIIQQTLLKRIAYTLMTQCHKYLGYAITFFNVKAQYYFPFTASFCFLCCPTYILNVASYWTNGFEPHDLNYFH